MHEKIVGSNPAGSANGSSVLVGTLPSTFASGETEGSRAF
jgi:hypothetical protein